MNYFSLNYYITKNGKRSYLISRYDLLYESSPVIQKTYLTADTTLHILKTIKVKITVNYIETDNLNTILMLFMLDYGHAIEAPIIKRARKEDRQRQQYRVSLFKEELMKVVWRPERVMGWLAAGFDAND